ncbi:MAG: hypothetical protein H6738_21885 [Alphaproteobacteria bacterium]|nr:hypothetical protein [Alphaproteobacteria bacterium]MCB9699449.1 hypothetical protein [Alphaproteobacteria bacterium]
MAAGPERWRRAAPWVALLAVVSALATTGAAWCFRGDPLAPVVRDGATLVLDREALARVDLRLVHEELVPDWVVATGGLRSMSWDRLRREAGKDPNLGALLDRMAVLVDADPSLNAPELHAIVRAWNELLAKADEPWRLAGEVQVGGDGARWVLKSYLVIVDDGQVAVGERRFRVELRRRVDGIGQPDAWLGHMRDHTEGIVLLLDRVTTFSLDEVWPLLGAQTVPPTDLGRRFAEAIREEVARGLGPQDAALLAETSSDRAAMMDAVRAIHGRHSCGSAFAVTRLPWNGLSSRDLATLRIHTGSVDDLCPEVLPDEAQTFATRSYHLQRTLGMREALERLVAFVAASVVVHEARHAADDAALAGQRIACVGCPRNTTHVEALEASAYLAAFADPDHAALALFQACNLDPQTVPERAATVGWLAERLVEGGCDGVPDPGLAERAAELERQIHLRSEPVRILDFPKGLPVSSEYTGP